MKKSKGITIVELIVVVIIVAILGLIAVPRYKKQIKRSMLTEGQVLMDNIFTAQQIYHSDYGEFYRENNPAYTSYHSVLHVDARNNKYFTTFRVSLYNADGYLWQAIAVGSGPATGLVVTVKG